MNKSRTLLIGVLFLITAALPFRSNSQPRLSPAEMEQWNNFLDYVKIRGYEGSLELNHSNKNLGLTLFNDFKKHDTTATITYDIVFRVQLEMQDLRKKTVQFFKNRKDPKADSIMNKISKVDGWFGSRTSQFRFPSVTYSATKNGKVIRKKDLGLVAGDGTSAQGFKLVTTPTINKDSIGAKASELKKE